MNKLGGTSDKDEKEREIIGLTDEGTLVLPDEPPKQKPLAKASFYLFFDFMLMIDLQKKKSKGAKQGTSAMVKGHHRKTKT